MALQIFTSNRVSDGIVVFQAKDGSWTESLDKSYVIRDEDALAKATLRAEAADVAAVVIDPYPIDVTEDKGVIRPVRYRERIRAYGPTIHPDFAKMPALGHFLSGD
jgi:hypothetical protein